MSKLSYGDYMKTGLKIDRLQTEAKNIQSILSQLNANGGHKITGIIYDKSVLVFRLANLQKEIDELNYLMDKD